MKRLHLHITVPDVAKAVNFYNTLFDQDANVEKPDYAKWLLDDPAINFAISNRGNKAGLNHLGFQVDDDESLAKITKRLQQAEYVGIAENEANCCYAKSNKYWTRDPADIPWENFHTLGNIEVYGEDAKPIPENPKESSVEKNQETSGERCC